jgi:thioredoxin 1
MRFLLPFLLMIGALSARAQTPASLPPDAFSALLAHTPNAQVVDARTPGEFGKGHLANALNVNVNSPVFATQANALDKARPVFVYCLSGGRSAKAAAYLREQGYAPVYELTGGVLKWQEAGLPLTAPTVATNGGLSAADFAKLLQTNKLVLVDFMAPWCAPCQKMKPILAQFARDHADTVQLVQIDYDQNRTLCQSLNVSELPTLKAYRNGKVQWTGEGIFTAERLASELGL